MHILVSHQTIITAVFLPYLKDMSKSPKNMKKLLPKRKPERKPSEEDFTVRKSKKHTELSQSNPSSSLFFSVFCHCQSAFLYFVSFRTLTTTFDS